MLHQLLASAASPQLQEAAPAQKPSGYQDSYEPGTAEHNGDAAGGGGGWEGTPQGPHERGETFSTCNAAWLLAALQAASQLGSIPCHWQSSCGTDQQAGMVAGSLTTTSAACLHKLLSPCLLSPCKAR